MQICNGRQQLLLSLAWPAWQRQKPVQKFANIGARIRAIGRCCSTVLEYFHMAPN